MIRGKFRKLAACLLFLTLWPAFALAQQSAAGVVTTLQGVATVARAAVPQEIPLKFKDDVLYRDRISTKENSIVRVLLGGQALVTVRELSGLTITEEPGRTTVNLESGKIALAVARQRMRPGESIEVRTPNAVASVRGALVIVEVIRATAQLGTVPSAATTIVSALEDIVDVFAAGVSLFVPAGFSTDIIGTQPPGPPYPNTPTIFQGLRLCDYQLCGYQLAGTPDGQEEQGKATALLEALLESRLPRQAVPFQSPSSAPPSTPSIGVQERSAIQADPQGGGGAAAVPKVPTNLIVNGGFETNSLAPWGSSVSSVNAIAAVIPSLGPTLPPVGMKMAQIATDGCSVPSCGFSGFSRISQTFTASSPFVISFKYKILTNEDVPGGFFNNDTFTASLAGSPPFFSKSLSDPALSFTPSGSGFSNETTGGFMSVSTGAKVGSAGSSTLIFEVVDVEDPNVGELGLGFTDTAVLIDDVQVLQDPPLLVVRDGARYTSTQRAPLFTFSGETRTFDSLLLVCCPAADGQPSTVSLAGPLLRATNSNLTVPFFLVALLPGGFLTTSSTDPLVLLEGGRHSLGSMIGVFDIEGANAAVDPTTGLTLGTDRSLQFGGELFRGDLATSVATNQLLRVDTALLEASAPLLNLMAGSSMTSASDLVQLAQKAKVTANVPSDALIKLNASTLTVANGSLFNVRGGAS